jgi:ATP-dependent Clp protease ATP-binding subunit ClpB
MAGIVDIQIARLQKLLDDRKITLELSGEAKIWLADAGYDPVYGARPLKRTVQKHVQNELAEQILRGEIKPGDTVEVTLVGQGLALAAKGRTVDAA